MARIVGGVLLLVATFQLGLLTGCTVRVDEPTEPARVDVDVERPPKVDVDVDVKKNP